MATVPGILVENLPGALEAARSFDYPVVLKGRSPGLVHKTEAGLVQLDLHTPEQLQSAFREMTARSNPPASFMVQPQLKGDLELIAGVVQDTPVRCSYPVVLKGRKPGQIHKTEAGLVKVNLYTPEQLKAAFLEMAGLDSRPTSFLVQPQLQEDLELIVGMVRDPQFGPAVLLGLGGTRAEVYRDVVFRLAPVDRETVRRMAEGLKGRALFQGYRGAAPVKMDLLAEWLIRLGELARQVEAIQEIDVNPLLIVKGDPIAVDASIILG